MTATPPTTCAEVRERLLEADTDTLDTLQPHLRACPDCAALTEAVLHVEDGLRTHLEDTVDAMNLHTHWSRATAAVPERRTRWLHGGLIGLAAAAVLAVGVWSAMPHTEAPGPPDGPEADIALASPALFEALDAVDAFDDVRPPEIHDGLARTEQDARLQAAMQEKADAFLDAEEALLVAADADEPGVRAAALLELGDLYLRMAEALLDLPRPTYLTEGQAEFYGMALEDKAHTQLAKARDMLDLGLELAEDHDLRPEIDAFDEALLDVEAVEASLLPEPAVAPVPEHASTDAHRTQIIQVIGERLGELVPRLDCDGEGRVQLDFVVEPDGSVTTPSATPLDADATPDLAACVVAQMGAWRFPRLPEPASATPTRRTVTFPLSATASSPLEGAEVKRNIERYTGQLQYCYERGLEDQPDLHGTVEVRWTIGGGAVVGTPIVVSDSTGDASGDLAACVVRKIRRWRFPTDADGEVSWPFVFRTR